MSEAIQVYVVQKAYNTPTPMSTEDLKAFIAAMEGLAIEHYGAPVVVDAPEGSSSFRFTFNVEGRA